MQASEYQSGCILIIQPQKKEAGNACIEVIKHIVKKSLILIRMYLVLLQICSSPIGQELPSPAALLFNRPIRGLMPTFNRPPIPFDYDDGHYNTLIERQQNTDMTKDTHKNSLFLHIPLWPDNYFHYEIKKNTLQASKRCNELLHTYAILYGVENQWD